MTQDRKTIEIIHPAERADTKKQLLLFLLVTYGVTYASGLLIWYGSAAGMVTIPVDMTVSNAQMFCPAAGVMFAYLITRWKDDLLPRWFYLWFLLLTTVMLLCALLCILWPGQPIMRNGLSISRWQQISQSVVTGGSILGWIALLLSGRKRRTVYGLSWKQGKASFLCILAFFVLTLVRAGIFYIASGQAAVILTLLQDETIWLSLITMPLIFPFSFATFFGEEYGWRYYLQPVLQKRFGLRGGVLILGIVWGLWHIFLDFFFFAAPGGPIATLLTRFINCVPMSIFLAWAYLKTDNIWVPAILHFMNNSMSILLANEYAARILLNPELTWIVLPSSLIVNGLLFGSFLLAKEFRKIR